MRPHLALCPTIISLVGTILCAQQTPSSPTNASAITIPTTDKSPSMAGASVEGWENALVITDFHPWLPANDGEPKAETKAKLIWSKDALYIAVEAYDPAPSQIRSFPTLRDKLSASEIIPPLYTQDTISVDLDPSGKGASAITFVCNPNGSKQDGRTINFFTLDTSYDLDWSASAIRTDFGYIIKFRIPLNSIQGVRDNWKVRITRAFPREYNYVMSWPKQPLNQDCTLCEMATISAPTNAKTSNPFYFIPFVTYDTQRTTDPTTGQRVTEHSSSVGFDTRFATITKSFESTYKPDFSAIEADVDPLAVNTRFKVYYPEKRPFFMNGMDTLNQNGAQAQFYSRSIIQPEWAVKGNGNESWGTWCAMGGKDVYGGTSFGDDYAAKPTADAVFATQFNTDSKGSAIALEGTSRSLLGEKDFSNKTSGVYATQIVGHFTFIATRSDSYSHYGSNEIVRGFADSISASYSDSKQGFSLAKYRTSPDLDFAMGLVDFNGYTVQVASYRYRLANSNKSGVWSSVTFNLTQTDSNLWSGEHFQSTTYASVRTDLSGGLSLSATGNVLGKETYVGQDFDTRRVAAKIMYYGIKGLKISVMRAFGNLPDYYTATPAREVKDTIMADWSNPFFTTQLQFVSDTLHDKDTGALNLKAKRIFLIFNVALPHDFYARATIQNVNIDRPTKASSPKSQTLYQQFLFGWRPSAFTNLYVGHTTNRKDNYILPYIDLSDRFFVKASYSMRF